MAGFDDPGIFFSDNFGAEDQQDRENDQISKQQIKNRFRNFIRQFHEVNFTYKYRDQLKRRYNMHKYFIELDLDDLADFDSDLAEKLIKSPVENLPLFEDAAKEVADELTSPRGEGDEDLQDIQITLQSSAHPASIRELRSDQVSHLVKVPGIVIAATSIRSKATQISIQCRSCRNYINNIPLKAGFEGYAMPRKCPTDQAGRPKCPLDPFYIVPEKCKCVDFQMLKLQEVPETVPNGEMPRHLQLYCDRYLCDVVVPGNRVEIIGVYCIKKVAKKKKVPTATLR